MTQPGGVEGHADGRTGRVLGVPVPGQVAAGGHRRRLGCGRSGGGDRGRGGKRHIDGEENVADVVCSLNHVGSLAT